MNLIILIIKKIYTLINYEMKNHNHNYHFKKIKENKSQRFRNILIKHKKLLVVKWF